MSPSDKSKRILSDHKLVGKKLVPPIRQLKGGLETIEWLDVILPDVIWIALLQENLGHKKSVDICVTLGRINREIIDELPTSDKNIVDLVLISNYVLLSKVQFTKLKKELEEKNILNDLIGALSLEQTF